MRRGGELIPLPPKVASTLLVLVENAGRMVDKADLMKAVWPDTFVEENALTRNVSLLRKALGDTGDQPAYVETIARRGYRFIAPVRAVEPGTPRPRETEPDRAAQPALAVLPFRSVDEDASQAYFADGMTQALVTRLANVRNIRIVSLASAPEGRAGAAAWEEILRNDSITRVLAGTILRSGGRVRIDAHLIDPRTRAVNWARSYERTVEDVLDLESAVASAISGEIQSGLSAGERERPREKRQARPEAFDAYLRGRYFWNRRTEDGLRRAAESFRQAIAADPAYAPAYAGLADSYSLLGSIGTDAMRPTESMPLAKDAARKAIELDPELADGYTSLAYVELSYDWDLPAAGRDFAHALELNPNSATARHWYSHYFMAAGDLDRAMAEMREALSLEPLSPSINIGVGWCLYYARKYDAAIEQFRLVTEIDPALPLAHQTLGLAYQQKGLFESAIREFQRAAELSNDSPASIAALAGAYAAAGRTADARRELARLTEMARTRYVPAFYFAAVHYAMGNLGKAFQWGWKVIAERCDYLMYLRVEPWAGRLAGNPEFIRALAVLHR